MTAVGRMLLALLCAQAAQPAAPDLKARVRELHANGKNARVALTDSTVVRGRIVRVDDDSFALRPKNGASETVLEFARVKDVRKDGLSRRTKAILIPAAIGGGALLVFCAAPYPIGYLCRKDPS